MAIEVITVIVLLIVFLIAIVIAYLVGHKAGTFKRDKYWESEIPGYRKDAILKSRVVLGGQFSEQLAPFLPDFEYLPTECRFVGKPVDLIVFKGMDDKNINEVVFVEVKSGKATLSPIEKRLKETIEKKKVRWEEYRIPEELTEKRDVDIEKLNLNGIKKAKKFVCEICGKPIDHKGKCLVCNMKEKRK